MTSSAESPDLLSAIVAATQRMVEVRAAQVPLEEIDRRAAAADPRPGLFKAALSRSDRINVIAECKRRSPSRGVLKMDYDPAAIASRYERGGAAAISVLTEPAFFDGHLDHLAAVRQATTLPILRKDFIVDLYQVLEARAGGRRCHPAHRGGADAAGPDRASSKRRWRRVSMYSSKYTIFSNCLSLSTPAPSIVGVNNRNLRTLAVDTDVSRQAVELIPDEVIAVAESGLKTPGDIRDLKSAGYDAFLIGERFMSADDPGLALGDLLRSAGQ